MPSNIEPTYFVVQQRDGIEHPAIIYDKLPAVLTRKISSFEQSPIVYILRLDTLPDSQLWLSLSLTQLYNTYRTWKKENRLPTSNVSVKPTKMMD